MPIYEYDCAACGHRHEILQKVGATPTRKCPDCGKAKLVKLVSAAGFRLAGSGWYETDFKTGAKRNLAGADTKGATAPSPSASTKSTSKSTEKKAGSGGKDAASAKPAANKKPSSQSV